MCSHQRDARPALPIPRGVIVEHVDKQHGRAGLHSCRQCTVIGEPQVLPQPDQNWFF